MQILVLGMHRSGTSVVSRLLNMMGAYFAPEGVEMPAHHSNPKGFWERKDVYEQCKKLLASIRCDWQRLSRFNIKALPAEVITEFKEDATRIILGMDAHRPWFLKEPRMCLLAPLWLELFELPVCVFVYRSPLEVARSLETRNGFSGTFSFALWERYTTSALNATLGLRRIQVNHADLMSRPVPTVRTLEQQLKAHGVRGLRTPTAEEILAFIDPALYRAREQDTGGLGQLSTAQRRLRDACQKGTALLATKPIRFSVAARAELRRHDQAAEVHKESTELEKRAQTQKELEAARAQVAAQQRELADKERLLKAAKEEAIKNAASAEKIREALRHEMKLLRQEAKADATNAEILKRDQEIARGKERNISLEKANAALTDELGKIKGGLERSEKNSTQFRKELEAAQQQIAVQQSDIADLTKRVRTASTRIAALNQAVEDQLRALKGKDAQIEELAQRSRILKQGLDAIEEHFSKLRASRSFQFMVYTARRMGLVSRTPRCCVEAIKNQFPAIRKALKQMKKAAAAVTEAALPSAAPALKNGEAEPGEISTGKWLPGQEKQESASSEVLRDFDTEAVDRISDHLTTPVLIVVPIYNRPAEVRRCVDSVLLHTKTPFELILVDDHSPDPAINSLLEKYEAHSSVRVIRNPANYGFVRSANIGIAATQRDVVLLNSDTEVPPRWLQKLAIAAYSDARIATVTPFSNAAGAFSVPEIGVNAPIPFPFTPLKMARLTERLSSRVYPEVPTGNGFCMYLKRAVWEEVGGFDEEKFGRGYGEENDFCMRARQAGWRNVIDDSLFVYHRGNSSFGEEKQALLKKNREALDLLHPTYTGLVQEFKNSRSINLLRSRIGERLGRGAPDLHLEKPRILFILQEGSGGVPMTNADLVSKISDTHQCFLLTSTGSQMILKAWENGRAVEKQQWALPGVWSAQNHSSPSARRIYFQVLAGLGIDLVHIRHLFKHSFDAPFLCKQLGIPVVLSFHDYYFVCPSIHLLDQNAKFCGGQCTPGLQQCTIPSPMLQDLPMLKQYLPEWRGKVAEVLDCCDAFVTTADSVRNVHLLAYPQLKQKPFWVIEHGREIAPVDSVATAPEQGKPVRILVAGNIDHHKGSALIRQLNDLDKEGLLEFHFLGKTDEELHDVGVHHGPYKREDFPALAREIRPSFAAVLSIWAETYSHTLTEAWSVGLPVLGSKLGAVGERIARDGGGWTVDTSEPPAILTQIRQIIGDPAEYQKRLAAASGVQIAKVEDMADAYRALYDLVLVGPTDHERVRVGSIKPRHDRPSTYIRVLLPLDHEEMRKAIVAMRIPSRFRKHDLHEWIARTNLDVVVVQRDVLGKDALTLLVNTCRAEGIRLLLEIDDNLLEIDESHAQFAIYRPKVDAVRYIAREADQIVVSTANLSKAFSGLNPRRFVIPNALDEWLWFSPVDRAVRAERSGTVVMGYMGTVTHKGDLALIRDPFFRARERLRGEHNLDLVLQLIGGEPDDASSRWYERLPLSPENERYPTFVRWLRRSVTWDLAVAPLVDTPLNSSKSALKFFEYAALGVPGIFSPVGEYSAVVENRKTGLLLHTNDCDEWENAIVELASSPALRSKIAENAQRTTRDHHLIRNRVSNWKSILGKRSDRIHKRSVALPDTEGSRQGAAGSMDPGTSHVRLTTLTTGTRPFPTVKADVVIPIHNALEDVTNCLRSIVKHRTGQLNKLILVDDGSDEVTGAYLAEFAQAAPLRVLLVRTGRSNGYTKAANRGVAEAEAGYVILLNSDTIVTPGWVDRLIACGESDPAIGIVGPVSNAASWQSVPERYSGTGDWAVNELPIATLDQTACRFTALRDPKYPKVPLVNGFCFTIKRALLDAIGPLDDVLFAEGYGEENDYCLRANKAGFLLAVADDCYVYHAKSKSYSHQRRRELAKRAGVVLREKYGTELDKATAIMKRAPELEEARRTFAHVLEVRPCSILFLMHFRGSGGGVNSIVQEAVGLRELGAAVQVSIRAEDESFYRARFPQVPRNLFPVHDTRELLEYAGGFDCVVATLFTGVRILKTIVEMHPAIRPCYYIQDYEPSFFSPTSKYYEEALQSYTLIPKMNCFAKTRWLCDTVIQRHGVHVHKVQPSIDRDIFFADDRPKPGLPFIVCAMVRPATERRSPQLTFDVLRGIKLAFPARVEVRMFGIADDDPFLDCQRRDFDYRVVGILTREQVAELMREASLFIDASAYQAFGRSGLEAMACRCATILPTVGGINEYAVHGVNTLLASPNDAEGIFRSARRYLEDAEFYARILEAGLRTASRYSIRTACVSELEFFERVRQADGGACVHQPEFTAANAVSQAAR